MKIRSAAETHVGYRRGNNEDAFLADAEAGLFVVCDGMGGHQHGEVASRIAVDAIVETWRSELGGRRPAGVDAAAVALWHGFELGHARVVAEAARRGVNDGMGTTAVAAILLDNAAVVASSGDSRAYHAGAFGLRRVTRDHTVAEHYAEIGLIARESVRRHPLRTVLFQSLGGPAGVAPDVYVVPMRRGDRLLLCTDGLFDRPTEEELLARAVSPGSPAEVAASLIRLALEAGGHDNVTIVVAEREDGVPPPRPGVAGTDDAPTAELPRLLPRLAAAGGALALWARA